MAERGSCGDIGVVVEVEIGVGAEGAVLIGVASGLSGAGLKGGLWL